MSSPLKCMYVKIGPLHREFMFKWGQKGGNIIYKTSVLIGRGRNSRHVCAQKRGHMRTQQEGGCLQIKKRVIHASTPISDFHPPDVWENKFLLFKPPRLFVVCSVAQSFPTICDPMDCSTPAFPVLHYLLWFAQTHVHWVGDAIQSTHPLSLLSPPAHNLFQHQGLFLWISSLHQVDKVPFLWIFRVDFPYDWQVWSPCCPRDS